LKQNNATCRNIFLISLYVNTANNAEAPPHTLLFGRTDDSSSLLGGKEALGWRWERISSYFFDQSSHSVLKYPQYLLSYVLKILFTRLKRLKKEKTEPF